MKNDYSKLKAGEFYADSSNNAYTRKVLHVSLQNGTIDWEYRDQNNQRVRNHNTLDYFAQITDISKKLEQQ